MQILVSCTLSINILLDVHSCLCYVVTSKEEEIISSRARCLNWSSTECQERSQQLEIRLQTHSSIFESSPFSILVRFTVLAYWTNSRGWVSPPCVDKRGAILHSLSTLFVVVIHWLSIKGSTQAFSVALIRARGPYSQTHSPVSHIRTHKCPRQEHNLDKKRLIFMSLYGLNCGYNATLLSWTYSSHHAYQNLQEIIKNAY